MKKRILVLEFHQETNTFNPVVTQLQDFNSGLAPESEEAFESHMSIRSALRGAADALRQIDAELIPTVFLFGTSGGRVADEVLRYLLQRMTEYAENNQFDGIYASLHGATCSETEDDACGVLLAQLRKLAGDKPIAASFDLHANVTEKMLKNADVVCGYQTYPHRDHYETGYRAGSLLAKLLSGEKLHLATASIPMLIPPAGYDSDNGPFSELLNLGKNLVEQGKLMDFTVFPVQPWLDISELASRVITIARNSDCAIESADLLAKGLADIRDAVQPDLLTVDEIIDIAEANDTGKPVILSEFADSPNGGCAGDSPAVALRLKERGSSLRAALFVRDPEAVEYAFRLGVGGTGFFSVGAKITPNTPGPLLAEGKVCSLHDGQFIYEGPASRGGQGNIGRSAVVRFGKIDILLCSLTSNSGDPQNFRHFGIEPSLYDLIVVKANTSFRLPYGKISPLIYSADTFGAGAANLKKLYWSKLPDGLYPFVDDIVPTESKIY
ncbi:MAG: M81 family metallopeptidase [Clostridia bacterium]|nr:M81 family metallopeptidase [Clostridia bacterium]